MRDLLQPSLSGDMTARPIYSAQAGFWDGASDRVVPLMLGLDVASTEEARRA